MSEYSNIGVRHSILALQREYEGGNKKPLEDLVRAWKGIKELPPDDPRSFYVIGGYHGEPFEVRPAVDQLGPTDIYAYWGGYCNHGNVLFPTWHRVYLKKLEEALQSIVPGVMMAYWDETDEYALNHGIPTILTQETFELDGETIPNPLKSFVLPKKLNDDYWYDNQGGEHHAYYKPAGYETVRYPLSGLVGNAQDLAKTKDHNAKYPDVAERTQLLNSNVTTWLRGGGPTPKRPHPHGVGTFEKYKRCLRAPNYTVFSNTTSAQAWAASHNDHTTALEDPHNDIHLSIGGFDNPAEPQLAGPGGQVAGANGDMGENNTAAIDPIFFFHHCHVDRMFWLWQKQNGFTKSFDVIDGYAGTNSSDSQGPTRDVAPGTTLGMKTHLAPFKHSDTGKPFVSEDCIHIERQLGYRYAPGSLEDCPAETVRTATGSRKTLVVSSIDRGLFQGSFLVTAWATLAASDGSERVEFLGHHSVLSRYDVRHCANCLTHMEVVARFPLSGLSEEEVAKAKFRAEIRHRGESLPEGLQLQVSLQE